MVLVLLALAAFTGRRLTTSLLAVVVVLMEQKALFQTPPALTARLQKAAVWQGLTQAFLVARLLVEFGLFGAVLLSHLTPCKGKI